MIKQLLLGTFLLTSPQPYKAITNPSYIENTYNKTITPTYYAENGVQHIYGSYSFNSEDEYQNMNGIVTNKTQNLYVTDYNSYTQEVVVKMMSTSIIHNNYYETDYYIKTSSILNGIDKLNLTEFKIAPGALFDYDTQNSTIKNSYDSLASRYESPIAIEAQIDQAISNLENDALMDDSIYHYERPNDPNTFEEYLNIAIEELKATKHWTTTESQNTDSGIWSFAVFTYSYTGNWEEATSETKDAYINLLQGYKESVKYEVTYQIKQGIVYTEVIDIPGLLFTILGMPFAWISTAFNLTIFPGTPYAVNISHLILSIIGVLIAIFIIKRVIK